MKNRITIILIFLFVFSFCARNRDKISFEKEYQLKQYLVTQQNIDFKVGTLAIFINSSSIACGPCDDELLYFLNEIICDEATIRYKKLIITSEERISIFSSIEPNNVEFLVDSEYNLLRHGIDFSYNFLVEYDAEGKVVVFSALTTSTFIHLLHQYLDTD